MKKRNYAAAAAGAVLAALAVLLLLAGCESTEEVSVSISPDYVRLGVGQSVTLTASGWNTYRWSLGETTGGTNINVSAGNANGVLSSTVGERVVYRALTRGITQTIICYAVTSGGQSSAIAPGQATIVQQ
jgi:type IV pilus biogenesis protein CpaD/CtpE